MEAQPIVSHDIKLGSKCSFSFLPLLQQKKEQMHKQIADATRLQKQPAQTENTVSV